MPSGDRRTGLLCLGASAGGLRSIEAVLSQLPATFPWPILVSQHLQREHASLMPEILSRVTPLVVREAADGDSPVAGVVYTCPSDAELGVSVDGKLTLRPPVDGKPERIDHLFSTASFARPGLVVAVILSGTGSDGTAGSLVVKLNGGTVIAESDETAQEPAMARAALKAGTVDAIRPASHVAALALELADGGLEEMGHELARAIDGIARTLAEDSRTEFTRYRPATLRRRVERRQALVGVDSVEDYHEIVRRDPVERAALLQSLLLPVTEFFRDPAAWDALADAAGALLAARASSAGVVRVWCAGCASGEEAFSIAIALAERGVPLARLRVLATDLDRDSVAKGAAGLYAPARMANVDASRRARWFDAERDGYRAKPALRAAVEFRIHDLTAEAAPPGPFDLVVCRNVLIYFEDSLQAEVLSAFETQLAPDGFLFLGRSTALPPTNDAFEPVSRAMRVFRSRRTVAPAKDTAVEVTVVTSDAAAAARGATDRRLDAVLIEESTALILLVDAAWRIALANRRARETIGAGLVGRHVLDAAPAWQASPVGQALRSCMATGRSARVRGVPIAGAPFDLLLEPVTDADQRRLFVVASPADPRPAVGGAGGPVVLRDDLSVLNDELQTANEELAAANEELQASNEELASLNEEFLSTNQDLASTNAEITAAASRELPPTALLHAIVLARGEAAIACNEARILTLVTPEAARLLHLDATAIGKALDPRAIGLTEDDLRGWLVATPPMSAVRRALPGRGAYDVTVVRLRGPTEDALGWLLTWTAARAG